jgi:hypothetical protein
MAVTVTLDRDHADPGLFVVSVSEGVSADFIRQHRNYWSGLNTALRLQREYAPAVLHDLIGLGGANDAS